MVDEQCPQVVGSRSADLAWALSPSWVKGVVPFESEDRKDWTLGERFRVMMLSGRSALQRTSTILPAIPESTGSVSSRSLRSSRRAQRVQITSR